MKVQLYAVECSSYDGCNGWDNWINTDSISNNLDEVNLFKEKIENSVRCEVIKFKTIDV